MGTERANVVLLLIGYPPTLLFVLIYGILQPWWRSWWGRALMLSTTSLSALLGSNLGFRLYGWDLLAREGWLRTCVYGFIVGSAWLTLYALLDALVRARKERR